MAAENGGHFELCHRPSPHTAYFSVSKKAVYSAASSFQNIVIQENPRGFQPTSPGPFTV